MKSTVDVKFNAIFSNKQPQIPQIDEKICLSSKKVNTHTEYSGRNVLLQEHQLIRNEINIDSGFTKENQKLLFIFIEICENHLIIVLTIHSLYKTNTYIKQVKLYLWFKMRLLTAGGS